MLGAAPTCPTNAGLRWAAFVVPSAPGYHLTTATRSHQTRRRAKGGSVADASEELLSTRKFRVVRRVRALSDGSLHAHDIVVHPGAVAILPLLDDGRVCLIRNYRMSVDRTLIELPAGTLEPGEDPLECARRELIEETGLRASSLEPLLEFYMSPGILNEKMHVVLATGLREGEAALEPGEQIERLVVTWPEAMELVRQGTIQDAKTLAGLLYYDRLRGG
jgi:ADP-ribose pyrophosphatase